MATHDYVIANASGAAVRADLNNALAAIVTNNSSATEPATTYPYMLWADTTAGQLKLRNGTNDAWIALQELDGTLLMENGTAAAPGLAFASDIDTGLYRPAADQLAVATNGVERVKYGTTEVVFNDGAEDYDFRVEGSTQPSLIATNAGDNTISFGGNITSDTVYDGDVQMASLNGGQLAGYRNAVMNGNVLVRQRADTTANSYVADRWFTATAGCGTANSGPNGVGLKRVITIPAAGGYIRQGIELDNPNRQSQFVPGSVWTARVWATTQPRLRLVFRKLSDDATDQSEILAYTSMTAGSTVDGFTEYTYTVTFPDVTSAVQTNQLQTLVIWFDSNGAAASFTGMSFEQGPVASPYEHRPIGTELALCQRYFQKYDSVAYIGLPMNARASGSNTVDALYQLRVPMRAAPTGTYTGQLQGFRATRVDTGANLTPTAVVVSGLTEEPYQYVKIAGTVSSIGAGNACVMTSNGAGNDFAFEVDAEL